MASRNKLMVVGAGLALVVAACGNGASPDADKALHGATAGAGAASAVDDGRDSADQKPAQASKALAENGSRPTNPSDPAPLTGLWIGYGDCGGGKLVFTLSIRADLEAPGQIIAVSGGRLEPLVLKGGFDPASRRFRLKASAWRFSPGKAPFDLDIGLLPDADLLVIVSAVRRINAD